MKKKTPDIDLYAKENELRTSGFSRICGIDEVGRGPLAGPVAAGAVILPPDFHTVGLRDSKDLSPKKRDELYDIIREHALAYAVAFVSEGDIDALNILEATKLAMRLALEKLPTAPDYILVDGNSNMGLREPVECVVKGDSTCAAIAAASILAKVERDRYMIELGNTYPEYRFDKHKGYGTKLHYEALSVYGPSPVHRQSFRLAKKEA
ncbi:ribonuclease HII [Oscillospiraceae bacterium OttesenSCG-928-G22]|nr:ribonuclease HII [Oscillospiraceae bacterium OttesenSCG-928-G22]